MKRLLYTSGLAVAVITLVFAVYTALAQTQAKCSISPGAATVIAASGCTYNFQSGSTLQLDTGVTLTQDGLTTYASTRGAAASVTNNTLVAHGLGTTPTVILLTPFYAGSLTNTLYISATNATSFTVGLAYPSQGVVTITTVYWEASK